MPIVSSTVTADPHTQQGGARYVVERHTDDLGAVLQVGPYLAPAGFDTAARLASRAIEINAQLADSEAARGAELIQALTLRHQTLAEFAARYWAKVETAFKSGDKVEFSRLLWWLTKRLVAGDITDTQARNSYNTAFSKALTAPQWTTLRSARITPAHDRYAAMLAELEI